MGALEERGDSAPAPHQVDHHLDQDDVDDEGIELLPPNRLMLTTMGSFTVSDEKIMKFIIFCGISIIYVFLPKDYGYIIYPDFREGIFSFVWDRDWYPDVFSTKE